MTREHLAHLPGAGSIIDVPAPKTAHSVRQLKLCASCGAVGHGPHMLSRLVPEGLDGLHHGRCVVLILTCDAVLALPSKERNKLTLADTGPALMRKLLALADSENAVKAP